MARLRNGYYTLYTKHQTIRTADKEAVAKALATGLVPIYRLHKDGYFRAEFRKLVSVECFCYSANKSSFHQVQA